MWISCFSPRCGRLQDPWKVSRLSRRPIDISRQLTHHALANTCHFIMRNPLQQLRRYKGDGMPALMSDGPGP
jgi:hypothetical protein